MTLTSSSARAIALGAFALGLGLRLAFLDYETPDVELFLRPWYLYAARHGWGALASGFTNYTPFYTYLLVAAAQLDGFAAPLTLVKLISYPFEFAAALLAARLVGLVDPRPERRAIAFASLWLAPSVLHNGAFWGQSDSIWTFFLLLAVLLFCRDRMGPGFVAFAVACSIKLQAVFLGPLVLALIWRRPARAAWLVAIPVVYLALALPAFLAGRPLVDLLLLYADQAGAYRSLSKGAANLYLLVPDGLYGPGIVVGLAATLVAGLVFAVRVGRAARLPPEHLILAAAVSLALVPFLLPKMHDRFFYPFELVVIVLACIRPFLVPVAAIGQVTSALCTLPFDGRGDVAQPVAGLAMLAMLIYLATLLGRALAGQFGASGALTGDRDAFTRPSAALWFAFGLYMAGLQAASFLWGDARLWPALPEPVGLSCFALVLVLVLWALRRPERGPVAA